MPEPADDRLRLSDYITAVCAELSRVGATELGDGVELRADGSTLEVDIVCSLSEARQPEFWVRGRALREEGEERESTIGARQRLTVQLARRAAPVRDSDDVATVPMSMPWPASPGVD